MTVGLQVKGTVLLMPNGSDQVTSAPSQPVQAEEALAKLDAGLQQLLRTGLKINKKKVGEV